MKKSPPLWQLDKVEKLKVLLAAATLVEPAIYLIYDLSRQMPLEGLILLKDKLEELSKKGAAVIFLITEPIVSDNRWTTNMYYDEIDGKWSGQVDSIRKVIEQQKTLKEKQSPAK